MSLSPPPKVFIDTNVWFSAFYGSRNAEKLVKAHIEGKIQAVISRQVLEELVRNVKKKIPPAVGPLEDLMQSSPPKIVKNPQKISEEVKKWVDLKDQKIFQAAVSASVKLFITGNTKHFSIKNLERNLGVKILNPKQAIKTQPLLQHFK